MKYTAQPTKHFSHMAGKLSQCFSARLTLLATSVAALSLSSQVHADVTYNGFASTAGLTVNGSAAVASTSDGFVLRLTPATVSVGGSFFSTARVSTVQFLSVFSFRITNPGGSIFDNNTESGADGIVFVVQNQANNVGSLGQGIGYEGITPSIGVEFDTWGNSGNNDPSQSHVGINRNGSVNHAAAGQSPTVNIGTTNAAQTAMPGPELDDGDRWWSWVINNGANLKVYLARNPSITEPARPALPILSYDINLTSVLGNSTAYAGFTSATGAAWANHDILYWRYTESVPEPSSLCLLAAAVTPFVMRRPLRKKVSDLDKTDK